MEKCFKWASESCGLLIQLGFGCKIIILKANLTFWVLLVSSFLDYRLTHAHGLPYNAQTSKDKVTCDPTLQKYNHLKRFSGNL